MTRQSLDLHARQPQPVSAIDLLRDMAMRLTLGAAFIALMSGKLMPVSIGPIGTSVVELGVVALIVSSFLIARGHDVTRAFVVFALISGVLLALSLPFNPVVRALRDYSQIFFCGGVIAGMFLDPRRFVESLVIVLAVILPYAVLYGVSEEILFFDAPLATNLLFNMRLPALFLTAVLLVDASRSIRKWWHVPFLLVLIVLVVKIRTRGFHLALMIEVLTMLLLMARKGGTSISPKKVAALAVIFVGIAALLSFSAVSQRYAFVQYLASDGLEAVTRDPSLGVRFLLWGIGLVEMGLDPVRHVFGLGFGHYLLLDPRGSGNYQYLPMWMIHNQVLSLYLTGGAILLITFSLFLRRLYRIAENKDLFIVFVTASVLYSLSTPVLGKVVDATIFWVCLGTIIGLRQADDAKQEVGDADSRARDAQ